MQIHNHTHILRDIWYLWGAGAQPPRHPLCLWHINFSYGLWPGLRGLRASPRTSPPVSTQSMSFALNTTTTTTPRGYLIVAVVIVVNDELCLNMYLFIRHRALCTKWSVQGPCLVMVPILFGCPGYLFLMYFKGPHPRFVAEARLHRPLIFRSKIQSPFHIDFLSIFDGFWVQLGPPKPSQNQSKIDPRAIQNPTQLAS